MSKKTKPKANNVSSIAVVDVGSNSVRLVIYEMVGTKATPVYDKHETCGLARGLIQSKPRLSPAGSKSVLRALRKFRKILAKEKPTKVRAIGTAAMRAVAGTRAGAKFQKDAEKALGHPISVISGKKEAHLTALGLMSSIPDVNGVCGDLGGGSLELAAVKSGKVNNTATLDIGSLTLVTASGGDPVKAERFVEEQLSLVAWLQPIPGGTFYLIGGSWRALARLMMKQLGAPQQKVHGFTIDAGAARRMAENITRETPEAFKKMPKKISQRAEVIPYAAAALAEIIVRIQPKRLTFSGKGVREGLLVSLQSKRQI